MIESWMMKLAGPIARMETKKIAYLVLVGKPEGNETGKT
jgi:hypothetical protein